ncbi:mRNA 3' end processing factor [Saitoella coloradoensis]
MSRMPMSEAELDAIKQDYASSLQDLTFNSKPIITNLTIIAQENLDAASAIVSAIETHLARCSPSHKLPCLYLLDSICKNVGPPYTMLFARNLYKTFMDAYTTIDPAQRRKLEELLQTWKLPVPMSQSTQPVFKSEVTSKLENALLKARTALMQLQQDQARKAAATQGYGTPPALLAQRAQALSQPQPLPRPASLPPTVSYPYSTPTPAPTLSIDSLLTTLTSLLTAARTRLIINPADSTAQTQIGALTQLEGILRTTQLPPAQLEAVQRQLEGMRATTPTPAVATPPPPPVVPVGGAQDPAALFASLQKSGLFAGFGGVGLGPIPPARPAPPPSAPPILGGLPLPGFPMPGMPQPIGGGVPLPPPPPTPSSAWRMIDIDLTSSSLSKPRPYLIPLLYGALPLQCRTCGRRFADSVEGRAERDKHLDWHFGVNKRGREGVGRGVSRSWYLGVEEWIANRDDEESSTSTTKTNNTTAAGGAAALPGKDPKLEWVPTPSNPFEAAQPCPICREKFVSVWHEDAEEWVWRNAVRVNAKVYHATCQHEAVASAAALANLFGSGSGGVGVGGATGRGGSVSRDVTPAVGGGTPRFGNATLVPVKEEPAAEVKVEPGVGVKVEEEEDDEEEEEDDYDPSANTYTYPSVPDVKVKVEPGTVKSPEVAPPAPVPGLGGAPAPTQDLQSLLAGIDMVALQSILGKRKAEDELTKQ